MTTYSVIPDHRPGLASAVAAVMLATLLAIGTFAVLDGDSSRTRASDASVSTEESGYLGTRVGSADALERQAETDRRSGHRSPDAIDRPVAGDGSLGTAGSPDAIDRVAPASSHGNGSADAAERWLAG